MKQKTIILISVFMIMILAGCAYAPPQGSNQPSRGGGYQQDQGENAAQGVMGASQ